MTEQAEIGGQLSPTMRNELRSVLEARPDSANEHDREPERWTRGTRKATAQALMRRGLADAWTYDYPIGGYRAHLTEMGVEVRRALRASGRLKALKPGREHAEEQNMTATPSPASIAAFGPYGLDACNNCDQPVTTPNPAGYCDECLEETR